ncbi:MAG: hypothetical protein PHY95_03740 [Candidatus ainarchaeum sp.]|nr:hypothetical protein [Candidatus ainarchaeum sp.]
MPGARPEAGWKIGAAGMGRGGWAKYFLLAAALGSAAPQNALARSTKDINTKTAGNSVMAARLAMRKDAEAEKQSIEDRMGSIVPQPAQQEGEYAQRTAAQRMSADAAEAAGLFRRYVTADRAEGAEIWTSLTFTIMKYADMSSANFSAFMGEFMAQLPQPYVNMVNAFRRDALDGAEIRAGAQFAQLLDKIDKITTAISGREYDAEELRRQYGQELVDAVLNVAESTFNDMFRAMLVQAFDPNDFLADRFEPESWLGTVLSSHQVPEAGPGNVTEVFGNFIIRLERLVPTATETAEQRENRRAQLVDLVERTYHIDLSGMDAGARAEMMGRAEEFLGIVVHLARFDGTAESETVDYDRFVSNVEGARRELRAALGRIADARDEGALGTEVDRVRNALLGGAGQHEPYYLLRQDYYGRFAEFIVQYGILGTRFVGLRGGGEEAQDPRSVIMGELGLPTSAASLSGFEFLLAAYEKIGTRSFFRDRQNLLGTLNNAGVQELPGEEATGGAGAGPGRGDLLFAQLDLLGQYALVENKDEIFSQMGGPRLAQRRSQEERMAREEQYLGRLIGIASEISPGTAFFLFHSAIPAIAGQATDIDDFLRMCDAITTAVDHLTGYNSPYAIYGSQDMVNSYLHVQVPRAIQETASGAGAMTNVLARFVAMYPEAEDFRWALHTGVEPPLPVLGPLENFEGMWRGYVDWAFGEEGSRFANLPIELTALSFPQDIYIGGGFTRLEALIPASLGLGSNVDNTAAALIAIIAAMDPAALYSETEFRRFMLNEYQNIVRFFQPPGDLRVTFHAAGRASFYRPFDLYSRLQIVDLGLPPIISEAIWTPARGGMEAGGTVRGGTTGVSGVGAEMAESRGPTAGWGEAAEVRMQGEERGEAAAGFQVSAPGVSAAAMGQGVWTEQETDEAVLARLNGLGEDHDYAVLFDFVNREAEGTGTGTLVRGNAYLRVGSNWFRLGVYDIEGDQGALGRFANSIVTNLGPIGMAGYKWEGRNEETGEGGGMFSLTGAIGDPSEFAGVAIAGNTEEIFSAVGRYAHLQGSELAAGGLGFNLGFLGIPAFSIGLIGRGAALASDDEGHGGGLLVVDYNKQTTRVTASAGFDMNPVSYMVSQEGELGVVSYPGGFFSATGAARQILNDADYWEMYIKTHAQVTGPGTGETGGLEVGAAVNVNDVTFRLGGHYQERYAGEGQEQAVSGGGVAELVFTTDAGATWTVQVGGEYMSQYAVGPGTLMFNQQQVVGQLLDQWQRYNEETDGTAKAQALLAFGRTLEMLARIRAMSGQGADSLRESSDLMFAASLVRETATSMFGVRGVAVRGGPELEGEGEYGGAAGATWRMTGSDWGFTLSGNLGEAPSGITVGDASGVMEFTGTTVEGTPWGFQMGASVSRSVWGEWGFGGIVGGRSGRSEFGVQGSYTGEGMQGVDYVWNVAPYYSYQGEEAQIRAAISAGAFSLAREAQSFGAYQVGGSLEVRYPDQSFFAGFNVVPGRSVTGGGAALGYEYRDLFRDLESLGLRSDFQCMDGQWMLTFQAMGRW